MDLQATTIEGRLTEFKSALPEDVTLIAVSKTKPVGDILQAHATGHLDFGENKVQELAAKYEALPQDIRWHMIGHLQSNKVKYIAPFVHLIHSVTGLKLLREINKQAAKHDRVIDCLLQVKIAQEDTKFGLSQQEAFALLSSPDFADMKHIQIVGLMGMATNTDNNDQVRAEFQSLSDLMKELKNQFFANDDHFRVLSMGMTSDFRIAIESGSNMIRVGSAIFGARSYPSG